MFKLLILDVDGILTDGRKYYDKSGTVQYKTFCDKDWTAIKRFKALNINVIFLTGDPFNKTIADNRKIDVIVNRSGDQHIDKSDYLPSICEKYGVTPEEIVFAGDDIFDIGLMRLVKSYCPSDSPSLVQKVATKIDCAGGNNFVMRLFDYMTKLGILPYMTMQEFDIHMQKVYELDLKEKL